MSASDEERGPGKAFEGSKKKNIDKSLREKKWEEVQIMAFKSWINSIISPRGLTVEDIVKDLSDGLRLVALLETVSKKIIKGIDRKPSIKIQKINNLDLALKFMERELGVRIDLYGAEDIYDGNLKIILGMIYSLFRKVRDTHLDRLNQGDEDSSEAGLLNWIREMTSGYRDVDIQNFRESFNDGMAFAALAHRFDNQSIDYDSLEKENAMSNLETAFEAAEHHLHIPKLLDPNELVAGDVDERSVILYASLYFHAFVSNEERIKQREKEQEGKRAMKSVQAELEEAQAALAAAEEERAKLQSDNSDLLARIKELEEQVAFLRKKSELDSESISLLEQQVAMLNALLNEEKGERSGAEQSRVALLEEMEELKLQSEQEKAYSEQEREEMKKRLALLTEQEEKVRREREDARRKAEETAEEFESSLQEAEARKTQLVEEINSLRNRVQKEISRRRRKEAEAEKLAAENARLKQRVIVQTKARSGLATLKRNLEEHLEDMYKWRELHHGQVEENRFDLAKVVSDTEGKAFDEQVTYLDERLQEENRSLLRIVQLQDSQKQLQDKIDKEGMLRMKFRKEWRERWFRLAGNKLSWFEKEDSHRREGAVDLNKQCDIVRQKAIKPEDGSPGKMWPLKLTVVHEGQEKKLFIRAASKKERHAWFSLISSKISNINYLKAASESGNRPDTRVIDFVTNNTCAEAVIENRTLHLEATQAIAKVLPGRDTLTALSLAGANLTEESFAPLVDALDRAVALTSLDLSNNQLGSASLVPLVEKLAKGGRLTSLRLHNNKLDADGAAAIASHLAAFSSLASFSIHANPIGDAGAEAIANALAKLAGNADINEVSLAGTGLGDASAGAIAALLSENANVSDVDLSGNALADAGVTAICDSLAGNTSVRAINLSNNAFTADGAAAVHKLLSSNQDIVTIRISGNKNLRGGDLVAKLLTNNAFVFPEFTLTRSPPAEAASSSE